MNTYRNKLEYYFTSLLGVGRILSRLKILASFCCVGPPKVETLVALFCDKNVYFPGDFSLILKLMDPGTRYLMNGGALA